MVIQNKEVSRKNDLEVLKVEGWNQYDWLLHGFSTRDGGVSQVYGGSTLNLGWTKEDDPASVAENRRRFLAAVCGHHPGSVLVGAKQIHSNMVKAVKKEEGALEGRLQTPDGKAVLEADGLITDVPGVLLGVGTADCVPVLVADVAKRVVAAFHAGWRGTASRIVEHGVAKMQEDYGSRAADLVATVGPSIGPCCYTVGEEVGSEFGAQFDYSRELFTRSNETGQTRLDLWEANRHQLLDAGLAEVSIVTLGECTACARSRTGASRYFSHRVERGNAGRMLNVIGVTF
ncbi:MAG TPA: peptidoglycan editing factor PgeF [Edaphobacter sp.]|nr:peptidoglycan editing factor PgeF [Edaphobacter sp.]